jgi:glycosyltransferase involved in cell wall biosynthesis
MRIGLVIYGSLEAISGGYLYDRKLVEYLRAQGDTVQVISLPWRNYAAHLMDNFSFQLPGDVDILIQDELNHPSLILPNRRTHPYPIISIVHHLRSSELRPNWQNALYRWLEGIYLRSVDGFVLNSKTTENVVNTVLEGDRPRIVAYPPTDRFGDPVAEQVIIDRIGRGPLRILFVGNLIYRKGLHTLLEAVRGQPFPFRVDVIGSLTFEPGYVKQIQNFIAQNNLSSFITLHGPLGQEPLRTLLAQAHVLVVPSSYEGFGIVYLEGMCFGLPAIGTTAGAASEIITDGRDGFLVEPEDSTMLADRLRLLHEKRDRLLRMSLAARERYLRQPKWEETAYEIREFLQKQIRAFSVY